MNKPFEGIPVETTVEDFLIHVHGEDQTDDDRKLWQVLDRAGKQDWGSTLRKQNFGFLKYVMLDLCFLLTAWTTLKSTQSCVKEGVPQILGTVNYLDKFIEHKLIYNN